MLTDNCSNKNAPSVAKSVLKWWDKSRLYSHSTPRDITPNNIAVAQLNI